MMKNKYACVECDGTGETVCDCCDSDIECDDCGGTGVNSDMIDIDRWEEAEGALQEEFGVTWDWIEGDEVIGRQGANRVDGSLVGARGIRYADYLK